MSTKLYQEKGNVGKHFPRYLSLSIGDSQKLNWCLEEFSADLIF